MLRENIKKYTLSGIIMVIIAVMLMLPACSMSEQEKLKNEARIAVEESMAAMWEEAGKELTP